MRVLAQTDALTGLPNRRAALEQLAAISVSARRSGQPAAVGFLDIDHFKDINDVHGHEVGDQVLRAFARILRSTFRGADYVARMGGEEFLVVLPGASPEQAKARIESLSPLLATIGHTLRLPELRVTLSAGSPEWKPTTWKSAHCCSGPMRRCMRPSAPAASGWCCPASRRVEATPAGQMVMQGQLVPAGHPLARWPVSRLDPMPSKRRR